MSSNLQIDQEFSSVAQPVKDHRGNASPLALALTKVGIGRSDPPALLSLDEAGAGAKTLLELRRQEKHPLDPKADASMLVYLTLNATDHVFTLDVGGNKNSTARIHLGDPGRATNPVTTLGKVGIGTTHPSEKLEVDGNVLVTGDVILSGADCAEDFEVYEDGERPPGSVMVIADESRLRPCDSPYDRKVAGVVSGAGNLSAGIVLGRSQRNRHSVPVALMGRVFCRVDASYGPVEVGDLLTTSATPGHAMTATDAARSFGAIIGKALAPLKSERALIPVLVALQ